MTTSTIHPFTRRSGLAWALRSVLALGALSLGACSGAATDLPTTGRFRGEVWADNWFALSVGEKAVAEDSVPITTERSFNKEVFGFDAEFPLVLNFTIKDYKADDTGLEYIGTPRQQMGDGGFIAQIKDTTTGKVIAVSSPSWKCLVIHRAPLDVSCEKSAMPQVDCKSQITAEPAGWKSPSYDTSQWPAAVAYTAADVGAKEGYYEITWDPTAKVIWSASLKQDNTLLCKVTIPNPG